MGLSGTNCSGLRDWLRRYEIDRAWKERSFLLYLNYSLTLPWSSSARIRDFRAIVMSDLE
jgi:hypothetical protein